MASANVCCSIEMEPRTLRQGQLTLAREVAADVVQKMEPKEASSIFEGSTQVVASKEVDDMEENGCNQQDQKLGECKENAELVIGIPCQCSVVTNSNLES